MKIDDVIGNAHSIGITGHVRPDGDCIGSCLAMYQYLIKSYPDARVDVFLEEIPDIYDFIKGSDLIRSDFKTDLAAYDAFIVLDTGKDRTSHAEALFDASPVRINIDHHLSNKGDGSWNYIFPEASSTCELVYGLMDEERIDKDIAMALYTGIISDTGVFKYSNTSPATMEIGAKLIAYGFKFDELIDHVFYEKTYVQNKILGKALLDSWLVDEGRIVISVTDFGVLNEYNASSGDVEGIVSQLQLTTGVEAAIYLHQLDDNKFKVSLRSGGKVNVAHVAQEFGGGGHSRAAGITLEGTSEEIIAKITDQIIKSRQD
ncbi:DHH family phosphoesterase [Butyrivibrio sp. MC2013]|uniref:DHH family phosphoesterase n=1 Tax=Butyrivibrio sp. MC2013 TaxID=1280686 RepID=UPI000417DECB|nr:bifunctional oligoribonuclease/PAP phosphatase NrnA [Butyrivibrio sp. MC2013]